MWREHTHEVSINGGGQLLDPTFRVSISEIAGDKMQETESLDKPLSPCFGLNLAGAPMPPSLPQDNPQNSSLMSPPK